MRKTTHVQETECPGDSWKGWSFAWFVGIARHESRAGHLSIATIDERGPLERVCVFTAKSQIVCCKSFNRHLSRVSRRAQGGSLRAIDHWLVATTNNGSRYRSISTRRMTWWIPMREWTRHAPLALRIGTLERRSPISRGVPIADTKFASESNHRPSHTHTHTPSSNPPLIANESFLRKS